MDNLEKIDHIVSGTNRVLLTISAVFPFDFFPDTLTVDENKVTFINRQFLSSQTSGVLIENINEVIVESNLIFSTLKLEETRAMEVDHMIKYLHRSDALRARRVIQGLLLFKKEKVDVTNISTEELASKVEEAGRAVIS